ncbi:MAG: response regulator [Sulfuritalea sp.]|nr:response regulator [Sulfuritalea sp.]
MSSIFPPAQPSPPPPLDDNAVLVLTDDGERELREPGTALPAAHLEALVRINGHATVAEVLEQTRSVDPEGLRAGLSALMEKGLIRILEELPYNLVDPGNFFSLGRKPSAQAHAEAESNTEFLRRNGYYVNMARRSAAEHQPAEGQKLTVLVIDDDPNVCKLLGMYLKLEGMETRSAANREEIVAELRRNPLPDLVLLDVHLGEVNGFLVLERMRMHRATQSIPVIMLTAEATREAVLKGILGGADGYVTKPFQIHPLVKAVKTVLGLKFDPNDHGWDFSL